MPLEKRGMHRLKIAAIAYYFKNEVLVGKAIGDCRNQVVLASKFGSVRPPDGGWSMQ
jgi:hypothetical protein